jgi:hypothetical protein
LLAAGIGDCYELGRVFRNGEAGGRHNPEFTMLEWYRVGWDHHRLMEETIALVQAALAMVGRRAEVLVTTYRQLFLDALAIDPDQATTEELRAPLAEFGIDPDGLVRDRPAADRAEQPAVGRDECDIGLRVPAVDREDRGRHARIAAVALALRLVTRRARRRVRSGGDPVP